MVEDHEHFVRLDEQKVEWWAVEDSPSGLCLLAKPLGTPRAVALRLSSPVRPQTNNYLFPAGSNNYPWWAVEDSNL